MHQFAKTFEEYVQVMALESPHALILDWWRRLELAINDYFEVLGIAVESSIPRKETALGADSGLGLGVTTQIRELRLIRNKVAHQATKPISVEDATQYTQKAFELIWILARAQSL